MAIAHLLFWIRETPALMSAPMAALDDGMAK
jgi:hypothetical protein